MSFLSTPILSYHILSLLIPTQQVTDTFIPYPVFAYTNTTSTPILSYHILSLLIPTQQVTRYFHTISCLCLYQHNKYTDTFIPYPVFAYTNTTDTSYPLPSLLIPTQQVHRYYFIPLLPSLLIPTQQVHRYFIPIVNYENNIFE